MSDVRRYRALTREELEGLELEFARFLASQGMPATEWARVSSEEPGKVEALIWEFSTMFWETTTSRLTYLERNDGGDQWYFKFGEESAQLLRIDPEGIPGIRTPIAFAGEPTPVSARPSPKLGEHSEEIRKSGWGR